MDKVYHPQEIENRYLNHWSNLNLFAANTRGKSKQSYCVMLPPPNITGSLHMGHAFQHTIMDILIRSQKMQGKSVLWQVGTDHAGIATQMVVERQLSAKGIKRVDLERDKFVDEVWQWKKTSGNTITEQMRRLGLAVDWNRKRFTLDDGLSNAVREVFVNLYEQGLIYRGKRLVNWDPMLKTAVSDLEVENVEEKGLMYFIRYPLIDSGFLEIATTRPETILADGALAVNPADKRYKHLIGKKVIVPVCKRIVSIIADDYVDMDFGSGCVKITPAHDFNDYEVGKRHQIKPINIFAADASLNNNTPKEYQGLDRFVARDKIVAELRSQGLLLKTISHSLKLPKGDRTGSVIEPYLTDQWFVKTAQLSSPAIDAVRRGTIRFVPPNWQKTYFNWMDNIADWCVSRQIWWGHRIPAWYDDKGNIYVATSLEEAQKKAGAEVKLVQDEDVLDTWFSSALWPFSTLGWPEKTSELSYFYPTSVLVTGFDIIFFWVARMIMFGLKFIGDVPFRDIYITGLIRDHNGQKMSKSKGNVLDPIDCIDGISLGDLLAKRITGLMQPKMVERIKKATNKTYPNGIPAFGTDALRFTFASLASFGHDISFDLKRVEAYRNFCNKLWNAARFVLANLDKDALSKNIASASNIDSWIESQLAQNIKITNKHIKDYRFDLMAKNLYSFVWHDYCDWYLEFAKIQLKNQHQNPKTQQVLLVTLINILKLLHPIIPFITEEIYRHCQTYLASKSLSLASEKYPDVGDFNIDKKAFSEIKYLQDFILAVRQIRSKHNIAPSKKLPCLLAEYRSQDIKLIDANETLLTGIAKLTSIEFINAQKMLPKCATMVVGKLRILIPFKNLIDKGEEIKRLNQEIAKLSKQQRQFQAKLDNEQFVNNAPPTIVTAEKAKLVSINNSLVALNEQYQTISKL